MKKHNRYYRSLLAALLIIFCLIFAGCFLDSPKRTPDYISVLENTDNQCVLPNSKVPRSLVFEVQSARIPGLLGGKGARKPIAGCELIARVKPEMAATILTPLPLITDKGGRAKLDIKVNDYVGELSVIVETTGEKKTQRVFRILSGIELINNWQEGKAGKYLPRDIGIKMVDKHGFPIPGATVYFSPADEADKIKLSKRSVITDHDGKAMVKVRLGSDTRESTILVEVFTPGRDLHFRMIKMKVMSLNGLSFAIGLTGSLAIFLFGIYFMSSGLKLVAGDRMRNILHRVTQRRIFGCALGALVTAIIQSSSATTVMVVGFANAGLLTLERAISIDLGANIGTTITAQIVSFKIYKLIFPALILGVILNIFLKKRRLNIWGQVLLGFGFLFMGMMKMSGTLKPLKHFPTFINFFQIFDCQPVDGYMPITNVLMSILIGTILTCILQSSSATVALTMTLAGTGLINYYTAVALVLGDNIGTTITAQLAAIKSNKIARQTAMSNTFFNVLGASWMTALFYVKIKGIPVFLRFIDILTPGDVFALNPVNIERHIANMHTMFNICNVAIFLPNIFILSIIARAIIGEEREEEKIGPRFLEPAFINTPRVAIEMTFKEIEFMTKQCRWTAMQAYRLLYDFKEKDVEEIERWEDNIDAHQRYITEYISQVSQYIMRDDTSILIPAIIHQVNDAERIGDLAINIMEFAKEHHTMKLEFSPEAKKDLDALMQMLDSMFELCSKALLEMDKKYIIKARELENQINQMQDKAYKAHIERTRQKICDVNAGIIFYEVTANIERIADRLMNIIDRVRLFNQPREMLIND